MRLIVTSIFSALVCFSSAFAQTAHQSVSPARVIDLAVANRFSSVQEFWFNPETGWSGAEGLSPEGTRVELIVTEKGEIVRIGAIEQPALSIGEAAVAAASNGIAKIRGIWPLIADWVVAGWDAAGAEAAVLVDGINGAVREFKQ